LPPRPPPTPSPPKSDFSTGPAGPPPRLAIVVSAIYGTTALVLALLTGVAISGCLIPRTERWGTHVLARLAPFEPRSVSTFTTFAAESAALLAVAAALAWALSDASVRLRSGYTRGATPIVLVPLAVHAAACLAGALALVASPLVRRTSPWNDAVEVGLGAAGLALVLGWIPCALATGSRPRGGALVTILLVAAAIASLWIATVSVPIRA
jgi:hypothetical protein